jgi:hypothetical protein
MEILKQTIDKISSSNYYRIVVDKTTFYYSRLVEILKTVYEWSLRYLESAYRWAHRKLAPYYLQYLKPYVDKYISLKVEKSIEFIQPYYRKYVQPWLQAARRTLRKLHRPGIYLSIVGIICVGWGSLHFYFANPERIFSQFEAGYQQSGALYDALIDTNSGSSSGDDSSTEFINHIDNELTSLDTSLNQVTFGEPNSFFISYAFKGVPELDQEIDSVESVDPDGIKMNLTEDLDQYQQLLVSILPLLANSQESLEINTLNKNIEVIKSQPRIKTETTTDEQVRVIVDAMAAELSQFYVTRDRLSLQMRIIELRAELATELRSQWLALYNHHLIDVSALSSTYERMYFYLKPHVNNEQG